MRARFLAEVQGRFTRLSKKCGLCVFLFLLIAAVLLLFALLRWTPYPGLEAFLRRPNSVRYYDRNGELLQITAVEDGLRREYVSLDDIPETLREAFIFAEDKRFYDHKGVDPIAIIRAAFQNLSGGRQVSGASTITMQLARIIDRPGGNGLLRKLSEACNALRLEARFSKDEILELYLNSVPFAFQTEGVATAAKTFFASDLSMLSPAQIYCLAVIPRRPAAYNPLTHPDECIAAAQALQESHRPGKPISEADWHYAANHARRFDYPFEAPHLIRLVETMQTANPSGNDIYLSIDLAVQRRLETMIAGNVERYYSYRLTQGAGIVIDNAGGQVLAWVGSADYNNNEAGGQIDGVLARNQPGSSMKPFLYALALEQGFKPNDGIADVPMNFGSDALYIPQNFNNRFNGPMLFRYALASSLNIPAVYLLYRLGVKNYTDFLVSLGFQSLQESTDTGGNAAEEAGLGLALGNAPVSLAELAAAFSVFPRDGVYLPLNYTTEAVQKQNAPPSVRGNSYSSPLGGRVGESSAISPDTTRLICAFLSDNSARVLAFGDSATFRTSFPAMFKTGTANQYQSITALGATPQYTAAVWMGNFSGETVIGKTGSSIPAAIVSDTLTFLQEPGRSFPQPEHYHLEPVCSLSGMAPGAACFSVLDEYLRDGDELQPCTWHRLDANGRPLTVYPAEYQAWFNAAPRQGMLDYSASALEIVTPRPGFHFLSGTEQIPVEVTGGSGDTLEVIYDGEQFSISRPFSFFLPSRPGAHSLQVSCGGESAAVRFTVDDKIKP
jgi:penicillin-binding protein 1C